ncbi:MAG: formylglycine-generating enzyme family protein [Saprospiraceae bacterium]|nr:formylglycine-generating enzyme family protein [Saprospiraceae bacterium]
MKNLILYLVILIFLGSCGNSGNGELIGVQDREDWYQPDPFGMLFIPMGAYNMGVSDQDVPYAQIAQSKTVSVQAFYMDETEITNNEYRQFVNWVRDSIAHVLLGEADDPEQLGEHYRSDKNGDPIEFGDPDPYYLIDWRESIEWDNEEVQLILEDPNDGLFLPQHERFYRRKQIDARKLNFQYYWINYREAARKELEGNLDNGTGRHGRPQGMKDRSVYIVSHIINVFPDTLAWVHDFSYSFNEPMTQNYFWHPAYDNYPVVGVSWMQARAFSIWRTTLMNSYLEGMGDAYWNDFRLPTEAEWEWAARGGLDLSPYPWGGPYIRNSNGCFLANYKPLRGNYLDDGGIHTLIVAHYAPNDWGLYDMAGNVAEWTSDAFNEGAYNFAHDLNPQVSYEAQDNDNHVLKRKTIRGGSWKDIGYYIRTGTRSYEYQDTAKCYIGFRNVQTYLGRAKGDGPNASNVYH